MMKIANWIAVLLWLLLWPDSVIAVDFLVDANGKLTKAVPIIITDTAGNPISAAQTLSTVDLFYSCSGQAATQFNETGDLLTRTDATNDPSLYDWTSDDVLVGCSAPNIIKIFGLGTDRDIPPLVADLVDAALGNFVAKVTVGTGSAINTIVSADFSQTSNLNWVGVIFRCSDASVTNNRNITLKATGFAPATDTVTLNGNFATALVSGDVCYAFVSTLR